MRSVTEGFSGRASGREGDGSDRSSLTTHDVAARGFRIPNSLHAARA
jgi:hypothetical protein